MSSDTRQFAPTGGVNYNFRYAWTEREVTARSGRGSRLVLDDGRELLDLYSAYGARMFPHGCAPYRSGIADGLEMLTGCLASTGVRELFRRVQDLFPHHEQGRLCVTGTEAVQLAIRLARATTGRKRVLRFAGHYHGHLDALLGGTYGGPPSHLPAIRGDDMRSSEGIPLEEWQALNLILPPNDVATLAAVADAYAEDIAAVILEPYPVNSGAAPLSAEFLDRITAVARRTGAQLIFDEVITGVRAGFGGYQATLDVRPDITVIGKGLGGGAVPVSMVLASERVMSLCRDHRVVHGGTFNGNPASVHAAVTTLRLLQEDESLNMSTMLRAGQRLMAGLEARIAARGLPAHVSGIPGAVWIHPWTPADAQDTEERVRRYNGLQRALINAAVLPAVPSRLYVATGMSDDDVDLAIDSIAGALEGVAG